MGYAAAVALVGLMFSMISIKLMSMAENAQITMIGAAGRHRSRILRQNEKIVAAAIGARKFLAIRIGIVFFGRLSSLIFLVEDMYPEKFVEGATMAMMNTVMLPNKLGKAVKKHGKGAAKKVITKYNQKRKNRSVKSN